MKVSRHLHLMGATGAIRTATFHEREHIVVPVVALVEGVIFPVNADTPELVLASEFSAAPQGWNGRPVVAGHPTENGTQVSANSPKVLESRSFGTVFNTRVANKRLLMEAWLDPARAKAVGPDAERMVERALAGEPIEVSVGVFVLAEDKKGNHNGKTYHAIWHEITPDHLAMLPEGVLGACSNEMGCGAPRAAQVHYLVAEGFEVRDAGGPGSGNFGHSGRPGEIGGSGGGDGSSTEDRLREKITKEQADTQKGYQTYLKWRSDNRQKAIKTFTELVYHSSSAGQNLTAKPGKWDEIGTVKNPALIELARDLPHFESTELLSKVHHVLSDFKVDAPRFFTVTHHNNSYVVNTEGAPYMRYVGKLPAGFKASQAAEFETPEVPDGVLVAEAALEVAEAALEVLRDIPQSTRDKLKDDDFAGPHQSFPIIKPADVSAAVHLVGKADNPSAVKARIVAIAYRKGDAFVANLPDGWKKKADQKAAAGKRNSAKDQDLIQHMHDKSVELGAMCKKPETLGDRYSEQNPDGAAALKAAEHNCSCGGHRSAEGDLDMKTKDERIKALIANPKTLFTADDQKMLETASDERLSQFEAAAEKIVADEKAATERAAADKASADKAAADKAEADKKIADLTAAAAKPKTDAEWLAEAPEAIRRVVNRAAEQEAQAKKELVASLKAAQSEYTEEELNALPLEQLQRIGRLAKLAEAPSVDFSARAPRAAANTDAAIPAAPDMNARIRAARAKDHTA